MRKNLKIKNFFEDNSHWVFYTHGKGERLWLDNYNLKNGTHITADDVTMSIGVDYILNSYEYGPGLCGFVEFLENTDGDISLLIEKLAPHVGEFSHMNIEDVVVNLAPYLRHGDFDMKTLYSRIDWEEVKEADMEQEFLDFFNRYAPELITGT